MTDHDWLAKLKLTKTEQAALQELYAFSRQQRAYCWKPATMRKLAAKGLAEKIQHLLPRESYQITEAGIALLPAERKENK